MVGNDQRKQARMQKIMTVYLGKAGYQQGRLKASQALPTFTAVTELRWLLGCRLKLSKVLQQVQPFPLRPVLHEPSCHPHKQVSTCGMTTSQACVVRHARSGQQHLLQ